MDSVIVMDDVFGLGNISNNFAGFLTVAWEFRYSCHLLSAISRYLS